MGADGRTEFHGEYFFAMQAVGNLVAKFLSNLRSVRVDDTEMERMPIGFLFRQGD